MNNNNWRKFQDDEQTRILATVDNEKRRWADQPADRHDLYTLIIVLTVVCLFFAGLSVFIKYNIMPVLQPDGQLDCSKCHSAELEKKQRLVSYFIRKGSPEPERMADGVLRTTKPRLMAALAAVESGGNPNIRGTGFRKIHDGAFQINRRVHGKVSKDAVEQALAAEKILDELIEEKGSVRKGLLAYGGDKTKKVYANLILKELESVPR